MKTLLLVGFTLLGSYASAQDALPTEPTLVNDSVKKTTKIDILDVVASSSSFTPALVDLDAYEVLLKRVKKHRKERLINLDSFVALSKKQGVIILDTRSDSMYNAKHIKGAIHLNFSDFTQANLLKLIPNFNTPILIYCNNNINEEVLRVSSPRYFVTKAVIPSVAPKGTTPITLALNIPTYINLFGYGYRNVYELNEFVSINNPKLVFEGTAVEKK